MREHRIYHPTALQSGSEVTLDTNATRHVVQVLRLKTGDAITLFDGSGLDYAASLLSCRKSIAAAEVKQILRKEPRTMLDLHLALGISRGERMDFSIQKAVELGVSQITPLFTERTLVQLKSEKLQNRLNHWHGVIRHACEQSGRSYLPDLNTPSTLKRFVDEFTGLGLLLDHRADIGLNQLDSPAGSLALMVGPEGGLSRQERNQAILKGFTGIKLGPRILRAETAPLAALAAMQMLWGDF